uniref:Uncharacterized protein n=1 Tax=Rhizophora mucronata TaxID=61149 RepID=A0A2P2NZM8_RHIMU
MKKGKNALKVSEAKPSSSSMLSCPVARIKYPPGLRILFISRRCLPPLECQVILHPPQ